ncbi:MAG: hypothetical protein C5S49_06225 [Candidatus Methanogaster sp.]|nr:MAG: hypothetical protein C5S49_06225 [ANME-2 cluster archaeon]
MQGQSDDFRKVIRVFIASPGRLSSWIIGRKKRQIFLSELIWLLDHVNFGSVLNFMASE